MRGARLLPSLAVVTVLLGGCGKSATVAEANEGSLTRQTEAKMAEPDAAGRQSSEDQQINVNEDPRARTNEARGAKVTGGYPAPAGSMLAVVGITYGAGRNPRCTGNLIEPDIVLTAAHCLCGDMKSPSTRVSNVFVGNNWAARSGPKAGLYYQVVASRSAITWPSPMTNSQCRGLKAGRDLAILKLIAPVRGVNPIKLAPDALTSGARSFRVAGFGAIDEDAKVYPNEKYHARVAAVSNSCQGKVGSFSDEAHYGCLPKEEIAAGNRQAPDSCNGDSGGPLLITANSDGGAAAQDTFLLAGVTSRPVNSAPKNCGYGGIYERLTPAARQWISQTIKSLRNVK